MNVRTTRDGVAEVFERDRVALIMQEALAHRYAHPLPSPLSDGVHDGHLVDSEGYGTATSGMAAKSPSSPPRLTCPLHYTLRRCSRTEYYRRFTPPIADTAGFTESSTAGGSPSVSTQWQSRDDEASVATAVAAECWRHAAFTALTQRDLRRLCGLPEETGPGTNGHRHDPTPPSSSLSATPVASHPRRTSPPLVTYHEFFEMPPRWAMQSLGEVDQHTFRSYAEWDYRRLVTPLDVGATVVKQAMGAETVVRGAAASAPGGDQTVSPAGPAASLYSPAQMMTERGGAAPPSSSYLSRTSASPSEAEHVLRRQERFRVRSTAAMARGAYWVDVVPLTAEEECDRGEIRVAANTDTAISAVADTENNSITCERVDRDALLLHPPVALYVDPLLPCDELYSERGVNTSVYVFFLRALQQQQQQHKLADGRISCDTAASDSSSDGSGMRPGTGIGAPNPPEAAAALALQLALCARQRRLELAGRIHRAINAANRSSVLRRVPSREVATCVQAGTAVTSAKCSGLGAPAVSLQVRVDHARGSVQLRALTLEDSADSTSGVLGSDWDASGRAATPTSSAAARPRLQDTETSSAAYTKRRREDAEEGEEAVRSSHNAAITKATRSPTVEVLLRSAWKLAALYDMTRSASLEPQQAERGASDEISEARVKSPEGAQMRASLPASLSSWLATSLLRRLTGRPQAVFGLTASGTTGVHSEASGDSSWSTVVLHRGGACSPSTMPLAGERVPCPSLPAGRIDHPSASSPPLLLADDDPPTGVPAATAIASTTLTTTTTTAEERIFLGRLFTLLLRYRTLFGEHGYNQGPQAAVPPPVMEHLAAAFEISAEAFASPLNAQLPQFGSLFPDTDRHFGSMGSFFDLQFGGASGDCHAQRAPIPTDCAAPPPGCHVEVNPPFDTTLLRHMGTHLLSCLTRAQESTQSLLFLIVLPSHDLTDAEKAAAAVASTRLPTQAAAAKRLSSDRLRGSSAATASVPPSTERTLRESSYCLGHVLCAAAESAYVDGHQHLLQSPFFRIETPTRLILLGNTAARTRFPHAATQLEAVRVAWKEVTESALRQQR